MREDEAGFGQITDPNRCWAPLGIRPIVKQQIIRKWISADGAVSPVDGVSDLLILPCLSADGINLFLAQRSDKYPDKFIRLISDCAPSQSEGGLKIPPHMMPASVPAEISELKTSLNM